VPNLADGDSGIGRQVIVHDINKDGLLDIASGGMKGAHVLLHKREAVSEAKWKEAQPKVVHPDVKAAAIRLGQPPASKTATRSVLLCDGSHTGQCYGHEENRNASEFHTARSHGVTEAALQV
jgi:hypothetical protein